MFTPVEPTINTQAVPGRGIVCLLLASDMAWMENKSNPIELVYGPIESYEDKLYGYKASFEAYVLIKDMDSRLKPGLTASLDIITYDQEDQISVPLVAVIRRGDRHFVRVVSRGKTEEREVEVGESNDFSVVVEKGLRAGEKVAVDFSKTGTE